MHISVVKINDIFMQYLKKKKINTKYSQLTKYQILSRDSLSNSALSSQTGVLDKRNKQ